MPSFYDYKDSDKPGWRGFYWAMVNSDHYFNNLVFTKANHLTGLRILLRAICDFETAQYVWQMADHASTTWDVECFDVLKGSLEQAGKYAKGFYENLFVAGRAVYGTALYDKAYKAAEAAADCDVLMKRLGRLNAIKSGKITGNRYEGVE